jgi:hypothetical protein
VKFSVEHLGARSLAGGLEGVKYQQAALLSQRLNVSVALNEILPQREHLGE